MGYGGALIWTGLFRNLKKAKPCNAVIVLHPASMRRWIARRPYNDTVIYKGNPDIDLLTNKWKWLYQKWRYLGKKKVIVDMSDQAYHYWSKAGDRILYKNGKHAIQIACDVHGIQEAELKPKIVLFNQERKRAESVLKERWLKGAQYIVLEPHTKESFTPNKAWFWSRWQALVYKLNGYFAKSGLDVKLVQVGVGGSRVLKGAVDLTGTLSFRETGAVLEKSLFFVGCLGGLVHLNKAVGRRAVVLVSAFEPLELASYPDDVNLYTDMDCQCRGLRTPCPLGRECMKRISLEEVYDKCILLLNEERGKEDAKTN